MNDFYYDVMQKKRLAHSAIYKKNGSKSKKCTLPQDHMTAAELKRRNGDIVNYNMAKPMKWATFKGMSRELQQEYVKKLRDFYNASDAKIAEMLGVSQPVISTYFGQNALNEGKVRRMNSRQKASWERFLNMAEENDNKPMEYSGDPEALVPVCYEGEKKVVEKKIPMTACKLVMTGDVYGVCKRVVEILGANTTGEITVYFNAKETKDET